MPTDFTSVPRDLPFPLDRSSAITGAGSDLDGCGLPSWPEDSDERITVLFRLSLNEFVALATSIDVGSDIAYAEDGITVWDIWVTAIMCAAFCDEVAACFTMEYPSLMDAVAAAIRNNPTLRNAISDALSENGGATPGLPLSEEAANQDRLPDNVRDEEGDCILDALWGACLYLVQSGNRAITDFFEQTEAATNTLETSGIIAQTIPAAGAYASAAVEFADQVAENLQEGYAAAYTETFEESLACDLFCVARTGCELTLEMIIEVINQRLPSPEDVSNFGLVMARIGTGTFTGPEIADAAFYIYFTALRFGQQFADQIGIRPLTDLMSLGADQLASDNWEVLCDCDIPLVAENVGILLQCGAGVVSSVEFEDGVDFTIDGYFDGTESYQIALKLPPGNWSVTLNNIIGTIIPPGNTAQTAYAWMDETGTFHGVTWDVDNPLGFPADTLTTQTVFNTWCSTAAWNAALFNAGPFSANFTVTAV